MWEGLMQRIGRRAGTSFTMILLLSGLWTSSAKSAVEVNGGEIRFSHSDDRAREVFLAGSFNDWSATDHPMTEKDGVWSTQLKLEPGQYEYKFVIDGQWVADPDNSATVGDFGNSGLNIAADGSIEAIKATSNTAVSPKILIGGRATSLYQYRKDETQDRFELDRPNLDFDLDFNIRINADLDAHFLTTINSDAENLEFFETRLNFDRGSLTLDNSDVFLQAWDNEGITTWEDRLHLVGNVGIYGHLYGYGTAGARVRKELSGFTAELLYTDDGDPGSGFPGQDATSVDEAVVSEARFTDGQFRIPVAAAVGYNTFGSNGGEDVLAARLQRDLKDLLGRTSHLGLLYRVDRGYRPGSGVAILQNSDDPTQTRGSYFSFDQSNEAWNAFGIEAAVEMRPGHTFEFEFLHGESTIDILNGTEAPGELITTFVKDGGAVVDTLASFVIDDAQATPIDELDLDVSQRVFVGLRVANGPGGLHGGASWEYEDHELTPFATGLAADVENKMSVFRFDLAGDWDRAPGIGLPTQINLAFELFLFDYDEKSPWETQMWFSERNFWLDQNEHRVSFDRLTLLGGNDAFIWKPGLTVRVHEGREVDLSYRGTLGSDGVGNKPKYFESLLQAQARIHRDWKLYWDNRIVRYDVPSLNFSDTFFSSFFEVAFEPVSGVSLAVSWGVDPYVVDAPVNEYDSIGRDLFLFAAGADAGAARDDFLELGKALRKAEELLEDEKRIQFEARLEF